MAIDLVSYCYLDLPHGGLLPTIYEDSRLGLAFLQTNEIIELQRYP